MCRPIIGKNIEKKDRAVHTIRLQSQDEITRSTREDMFTFGNKVNSLVEGSTLIREGERCNLRTATTMYPELLECYEMFDGESTSDCTNSFENNVLIPCCNIPV